LDLTAVLTRAHPRHRLLTPCRARQPQARATEERRGIHLSFATSTSASVSHGGSGLYHIDDDPFSAHLVFPRRPIPSHPPGACGQGSSQLLPIEDAAIAGLFVRGEHTRPSCLAPGLPGTSPPRAPHSPRPLSFPLPIPCLLLRLVEAAAAACSSICSRRELFLPPHATVSRNPKPDLLDKSNRSPRQTHHLPREKIG
jgi:hypothetical protein